MAISITSNHNRNIGYRQTGNLSHNRREFVSNNVDHGLISKNIVFKRQEIGEAYNEIFGQSIIDYNLKQKRSDRKKDLNYFKSLFGVDADSDEAQNILTSNARGRDEIKSFNEDLFQIGDCTQFGHFVRDRFGNFIDKNGEIIKWDSNANKYLDSNGNEVKNSDNLIPNPKSEIAKDILIAFYTGGRFKCIEDEDGNKYLERLDDSSTEKADIELLSFEERNPSFHVIDASIHNDEWHGTPHIHIDYIPVGSGYSKGPDKQLGFMRALSQMGYVSPKDGFVYRFSQE